MTIETAFDPELFGVSAEELLGYRTYMAKMARIEREAAHEASIPKVPTITITTMDEFVQLINCYASGAGIFSCAEAMTLIGLMLQQMGNPAFTNFDKTALPLPLPPGFVYPKT